MNKKGIQLAISTIIILLLAVIVLVGLIVFFRGGFDSFSDTTDTIADSVGSSAVVQACQIACDQEDLIGYCCQDHEVEGVEGKLRCNDPLVNVACDLSCAAVTCVAQDDASN